MNANAVRADQTTYRLFNVIHRWRDVSNWHQEPYRNDFFGVFMEACRVEGRVTALHRDQIWEELANRLMMDDRIDIRDPTTETERQLSEKIYSILRAWEEWGYALRQAGWKPN